jgi:hypothetical protein
VGVDGEWIRDETTGLGGDPGTAANQGVAGDDGWHVDSWPDDESPDDVWPVDERPGGAQPGEAQPGGPQPGEAQPGGAQPGGAGDSRGHGGAPGFSVRVAAAVAVLAAAAGVAAGLFLVKGTPTSMADGATPSVSSPAGSTGLPALPGLSANGNGQLQMVLTGRVLAVSGTSITIGGNGPSVTAAVTSATTITGTVHGIGGIKVGNEVSAQITGTASHLTATAIQDPAGNSTS